jgi:hypothetical protein
MTKSDKPRVRVLLLVVLAVTFCLHDAQKVTAGGALLSGLKNMFNSFTDEMAVGATKWLDHGKKGAKTVTTLVKHEKDDDDERSAAGAEGSGSTRLIHNDAFPGLAYVRVTAIKVGDGPALRMGSTLDFDPSNGGEGGVLLSTNFPLMFLNKKAYQQLKREIAKEFPEAVLASSELGTDVDQPCYTSAMAQPQPITLVFAGRNAEMKVEADKCWYEQSDGSMCLAILPSPWDYGETIIGTMLQTSGMTVVGDKLTF